MFKFISRFFSSLAIGKKRPTKDISHNPIIRCVDGFEVSVQAHPFSYSQRNTKGKLITVECGFPTWVPGTSQFRNYAELCGTDDYTETVYPYMPIEVVEAELAIHGGIVDGRLPS